MALTIWKFSLQIADKQTISIPRGAKVLACGAQHGEPQLWAWLDPSLPCEDREVYMVGTGHDVPGNVSEFIGTVLLVNDNLVLHIFV